MTARQALTKRQRRGAALAGIVGFLLATVGWIPFVLLGLAVLVSFVLTLIGEFAESDRPAIDNEPPRGDVLARVLDVQPSAVEPLVVAGLLLGAAFIAAGIVLSILILKRHGVYRAAGVTWLALAVAIIGSWVLDGNLLLIVSAVAGFGDAGKGLVTPSDVLTLLYLGIAAAIPVLLGWLSWWWMAHALRSRAPTVQLAPAVLAPQLIPGV